MASERGSWSDETSLRHNCIMLKATMLVLIKIILARNSHERVWLLNIMINPAASYIYNKAVLNYQSSIWSKILKYVVFTKILHTNGDYTWCTNKKKWSSSNQVVYVSYYRRDNIRGRFLINMSQLSIYQFLKFLISLMIIYMIGHFYISIFIN